MPHNRCLRPDIPSKHQLAVDPATAVMTILSGRLPSCPVSRGSGSPSPLGSGNAYPSRV